MLGGLYEKHIAPGGYEAIQVGVPGIATLAAVDVGVAAIQSFKFKGWTEIPFENFSSNYADHSTFDWIREHIDGDIASVLVVALLAGFLTKPYLWRSKGGGAHH